MKEPYYLETICPNCEKFHLVKNGNEIYCPAWWCRLKNGSREQLTLEEYQEATATVNARIESELQFLDVVVETLTNIHKARNNGKTEKSTNNK